MEGSLLWLSIFGVVGITEWLFQADLDSGLFPMKMLCFFHVRCPWKVSIPYYTACMRSWCLASGIFEEPVVHSLNSKMGGHLDVWTECLFLMATYLEDPRAATCSKSSQMPCCLKLALLCLTNALHSSFLWLAYFCLPFNNLLKAFYFLQLLGL